MDNSPQDFPRRGLMFILSSPSGAGKTTIAKKLLEEDDNLALSVSATTRPMRKGESEGHDYFFASQEKFAQMISENAFLEWAEVFGHRYGTPRAHIREALDAGRDFLFDVDWQGAQQLSQRAREDVVSVFLLPPSIEELEARLRGRATDGADVIETRMARARDEISHWDGYDYIVINDDLDRCFNRVKTILDAERLTRERQTGLIDFTRQLMR